MKLSEEQKREITRSLLIRLYKQGKWSNKGRTPFENLLKGFSSHIKGNVKFVIRELIKKGLLIAAKHSYGIGISLNHDKLKEIEEIIEEIL